MYRDYLKRPLDLCLGVVALVVLSPVLLAIAIMILLFDSGPILFRQTRVGRHGNEFRFYKFRTMPATTREVPSDQLQEQRLSAVGRLLRRTNLDELPQLVNILKGDMSFVGPRPPIASQSELIRLRRENGALGCRPGLTGLAQVCAFDGMSVEEKARLDGSYAARIAFLRDLGIIARTFGYLLKPPPRY